VFLIRKKFIIGDFAEIQGTPIHQAFSSWHAACEYGGLQYNRSKKPIQNDDSSALRITPVCKFGLFFGFEDSNIAINYCFYLSLSSLTTCRFFVIFILTAITYLKHSL
jgi:hypothetical protein